MHYPKAYSLFSLAAAFWFHDVLAVPGPIADFPDAQAYVTKGAARYDDIKKAVADRSGADETASNFCPTASPRFYINGDDSPAKPPPDRYNTFIQRTNLGISTGANNFLVEIGYPWNGQPGRRNIPSFDDEDTLRYDNYYSPKDQVIVAYDIWKGKSGKNLQPFSQVTWTMWDAISKREGTSPGGLKSLVHYTCANDGAKVVASWICNDGEDGLVDEVMTLDPGTDAFNGALGIDNGATAKGIVTQHKHALGFKSITSITVFCDATELMGVSYNFG